MKYKSYICIARWVCLAIFAAGLAAIHAQPTVASQGYSLYLPLLRRSEPATTPTPAPPAGSLPANLVGTWFSGQLLPRALYDPTNGQWGSANGLGQQYIFSADGAFTYLASFRIENPGCASEVTVYRQGTASVDGEQLRLQPVTVKTRTATYCGGQQVSVTDGPYDARSLMWQVGYDKFGIRQLSLTEDGKTTSYRKDGMAQELVGSWRNGDIARTGFYDPATGVFAADLGEGWWLSITADGHYRWGEFAFGRDDQGCILTGWLYLEGIVDVSGSHITFTPSTGVARVENACAPDQPRQEAWNDGAKGFTWLFRDFETNPRLVLMPDGRFEELEFLPD